MCLNCEATGASDLLKLYSFWQAQKSSCPPLRKSGISKTLPGNGKCELLFSSYTDHSHLVSDISGWGPPFYTHPSLPNLSTQNHCHLIREWVKTNACSVTLSCLTVTPWTVAHQAPLSMGFLRQEYWSRLPVPPSGSLLDPGIELESPALASGVFTLSHWGNSSIHLPTIKQCSAQEVTWPHLHWVSSISYSKWRSSGLENTQPPTSGGSGTPQSAGTAPRDWGGEGSLSYLSGRC